jgi:hypothetical protein
MVSYGTRLQQIKCFLSTHHPYCIVRWWVLTKDRCLLDNYTPEMNSSSCWRCSPNSMFWCLATCNRCYYVFLIFCLHLVTYLMRDVVNCWNCSPNLMFSATYLMWDVVNCWNCFPNLMFHATCLRRTDVFVPLSFHSTSIKIFCDSQKMPFPMIQNSLHLPITIHCWSTTLAKMYLNDRGHEGILQHCTSSLR